MAVNNFEARMQSVHEVIGPTEDAEHAALRELVQSVLSMRSSSKDVMVLDEHARRRALQKNAERQQAVSRRGGLTAGLEIA
jgi:hypothetical protein